MQKYKFIYMAVNGVLFTLEERWGGKEELL